jgi:hypothetical protein
MVVFWLGKLIPIHNVALYFQEELKEHSKDITAASDDYQNFDSFYEEAHH